MLDSFDPHSIKSAFDFLKGAIETFKSAREVLRTKGESSEDLDRQIAMAERQIALGEAQLAQALGYRLCRAHFPPVPMLKDRVHPKYVEEIHKCPVCGLEEPSPEHFENEDLKANMIRQHRAKTSERLAELGRKMC